MVIRVVAIEDHPLMLKAILDELSNQPGIQVVGTANHGSELQRLVRETTPDVVILDGHPLPQGERERLLNGHDLLPLPSAGEGWGEGGAKSSNGG